MQENQYTEPQSGPNVENDCKADVGCSVAVPTHSGTEETDDQNQSGQSILK